RQAEAVPEGRRKRHCAGSELRRLGVRDLDGVGVADDGELEGQEPGRGAEAARQIPRAADYRYAGDEGSRQAGGLLRGPRLSGAREVRDAGMAYVEIGPD